MKIIVITGASSGFGALTARALAKAGHTVYAGMRDTTGRMRGKWKRRKNSPKITRSIYARWSSTLHRKASVDAAIHKIVGENKRLNVVIHNAGHMVFGPAEAFTPEQLAELYDINVLSTQRVNRAALPQLRKQRSGLLVWVSSSSSAEELRRIWRHTSPRRRAWMPWRDLHTGVNTLGASRRHHCSGRIHCGTNHFAHAGSPQIGVRCQIRSRSL